MACALRSCEQPVIANRECGGAPSDAPGVVDDVEENGCCSQGLPGVMESFLRGSPQPLCVIGVPPVSRSTTSLSPPEASKPCAKGEFPRGSYGGVGSSSSCSPGLEQATPYTWAAYAVLPGGSASDIAVEVSAAAALSASGSNLYDDFLLADVLYSNGAMEELCGYSLRELRRSGLALLLQPPVSASAAAATVAATAGGGGGCDGGGVCPTTDLTQASRQGLELLSGALASGSASRLELPCFHSSGRSLWCALSLSPVNMRIDREADGERHSRAVTSDATVLVNDCWRRREGSLGPCPEHVEPPCTIGCCSRGNDASVDNGSSSSGNGGSNSSSNCSSSSIRGSSLASEGTGYGQGVGGLCRTSRTAVDSIAKRDSCECEADPAGAPQFQQQDGQQDHNRQAVQNYKLQQETQTQEQQQQQLNQLESHGRGLWLQQQQQEQQQQREVGGGGGWKQHREGCILYPGRRGVTIEMEPANEGLATTGEVHEKLARTDSREWARRCKGEQQERRLRLRQLQLEEQPEAAEECTDQQRDQQRMLMMKNMVTGGQQQQLEQRLREECKHTARQIIHQTQHNKQRQSRQGIQKRFLIIFNDVTAHKQLQQQLQQLQQLQQQQQRSGHGTPECHVSSPGRVNNTAAESLSAEILLAKVDSNPRVPDPVVFPERFLSSLAVSLSTGLSVDGCADCRLHHFALDALTEGITIADTFAPDYPIVYVNKAFLNMTGYSRAEVLGRNCRFLQGPDTDRAAVRTIRAALGRRQPVTAQLRNYTKAGVPFWNELRLEPILAPGSGQLLGYLGVQNDVTELLARKQSEAQLRNAKEAAESAAQAKSQFLANMSHEIRTPLNGMIATAQLLLGSQLTPEQRELTETVLESGSTLLGVLGDILDFSKIDHGSLELQRRPMCLRQATEACMNLVAAEAAKKGLALAYLLDDAVLGRPLLGDPVCIRQVLANLLSNAVKFTERGEVVVRVSVERSNGAAKGTAVTAPTAPGAAPTAVATVVASPADSARGPSGTWQAAMVHPTPPPPPVVDAVPAATAVAVAASVTTTAPATATAAAASSTEGDGEGQACVVNNEHTVVHIAVSDTGIGIGDGSVSKLFQHFRQGTETMSRRYGGTGLGLAISKRLAQLMEGDIWVESQLGVGSTFHFTLRAEWASPGEGPWFCSPSHSTASTPAYSSDCTPRSSSEEGQSSGGAVAAAAALGLDSTGAGRWSNLSSCGRPMRLSSGSGGSSGSGRAARELRTSPWLPDGTPVDNLERNGSGEPTAAAASGSVSVNVNVNGDVPMSPTLPTSLHRTSASGDSAVGSGGAAGGVETGEDRSALLGRKILIDVSHAATSTQVWNSCRQLSLAAVQANACALPQLPVAPPPSLELLADTVSIASDAATAPPEPSPAVTRRDQPSSSAADGSAATPLGQRVGQPMYDILVVSMDRLVPALKAGWKGRPVVALGDRELLPPTLQPLVVALAVPVRHSRLATALVKSTALLRWNGSSAPKLGNTPIPSESIQTLRSWRLKRGPDWEGHRRTSLDNSALERSNVLMRGIGPAGAVAGPGCGAGYSGGGKNWMGSGKTSQHASIPEHAELSSNPDDAQASHFGFRTPSQTLQQITSPLGTPSAATPLAAAPSTAATSPAMMGPSEAAAGVGIGTNQDMLQQQQLRILIAEDNKINQKVVLKVLQQILRGCQPPDVVENGVQVLQALQKKTYDLILMDIHMPEMDGLEASKRIQETYKPEERPRIIALSADTVQTLHDRCLDAGIEAFLVKPFRIEELARVMRTGAQRPRTARPMEQEASACGALLTA